VSTFTRVRLRLQNTNRPPDNRSCPRCDLTKALNPSKPSLRSVAPLRRNTRVDLVNPHIVVPGLLARPNWPARPHPLSRSLRFAEAKLPAVHGPPLPPSPLQSSSMPPASAPADSFPTTGSMSAAQFLRPSKTASGFFRSLDTQPAPAPAPRHFGASLVFSCSGVASHHPTRPPPPSLPCHRCDAYHRFRSPRLLSRVET
jgi:hypothetical protein